MWPLAAVFSTLFFNFRAVLHANQQEPLVALGPSLPEMLPLDGELLVDTCELLSLLTEGC